MPPKQSTHPLARSMMAGTLRGSRRHAVPASRQDEAVVVEDLSMRRKRTAAGRSSLLIPSDLTRSESPAKRHRATQNVSPGSSGSINHDNSPTPVFDPTPADFDQFTLPPELEGIVIDHQVPEQRSRKVRIGTPPSQLCII